MKGISDNTSVLSQRKGLPPLTDVRDPQLFSRRRIAIRILLYESEAGVLSLAQECLSAQKMAIMICMERIEKLLSARHARETTDVLSSGNADVSRTFGRLAADPARLVDVGIIWLAVPGFPTLDGGIR